ncbi:hypothetical protein K469DRAFT_783547 [Zopfia rhizophila CBS 207.26]|uniref:DUF7932 domain-containing protein n=1 Tax=Zopfia rhizophila CBS 207.26 TaxID=1314779 RepID=A0A6A6EW92_9PEZI|nr:hypothetical protein K469DRAFT_783547 [Zopfia rhizophila CBS 207.26]
MELVFDVVQILAQIKLRKELMQTQQLETVLLSAAGQPGIPGTQVWRGNNNFEAPSWCLWKTGSKRIGTICWHCWARPARQTQLARDRPGLVQLTGEGPLTGRRWEISRNQSALLDCRGGDGGDGGRGENGQRGGQGSYGRDATRYSDATCGGPGAGGGDGGRGTSGADGGDAGNVYITIGEDDLDTIVAVEWMTSGGRGGAGGVHGEPGAGGRGGIGGSGCSWTETHSHTMTDSNGYSHTKYYTTHHSRAGAPPGPDGPSGMRPYEPLYGGQSGRNGRGQIRVLRNDLTEGGYPSRYQLVVKSFVVVDENMDGMNEPGEFLLVQNIRIENVDPSKSYREIARRAESSDQERDFREASGTTFCAKDTVALVAFFERLQRPLPEFSGGVQVTYQYPIVMSVPKYLDCVAKGDMVQFSWTIRNISTKAYGGQSAMRRPSGTHMSDPCGVFDLKYADDDSPHEISDQIDVLDPGSEVPVTEDFQVSRFVPVFTTGYIVISLMLSDPHTGRLRPITSFNLRIQISSAYSYNPRSQFLLVINSSTPNTAILQTMDFINNGLYLPVDIFNLSLVGSFKNPETEQNVLWNYIGKSVIVFGNPMNYFQSGMRDVWDLLDPWEAYMLARGGTSFLFVCPTNVDSLKAWASQMALPAFSPENPPTQSVTKPSEIITRLKPGKQEPSDCVLTLPVKKRLFRSLDKTMESRAKSITKELHKHLPLRRFIVGPCDPDPSNQLPISKHKSGDLAIIEGLPHQAKFAVSLQSHTNGLTDYNIAMIVQSLPFKDQCAIFWNLLGYDHSSGISTRHAYRGNALSHFHGEHGVSDDLENDTALNTKACEVLSWSIATHITSELSHFLLNPSSSPSKKTLAAHVPFLTHFLSTAPTSQTITSDIDISTFSSVFGPILGAHTSQLLSLASRKSKIRAFLSRESSHLTKSLCTPTLHKQLGKALRTSTTATKKRIMQMKKQEPHLNRVQRVHALNCQALEGLTRTPGARFLDLDALLGVRGSVYVSSMELAQERGAHAEMLARLERDEVWSGRMLRDMVNLDQGESG